MQEILASKRNNEATPKEGEKSKAKTIAEADAKAEEREDKAKADAELFAKVKAEAETPEGKAKTGQLEVQMVLYELAKAEYHAAVRLQTAREFVDSAETEKANGHIQASERLANRARERLLKVFNLCLETKAAEEAKQLLNGEVVPVHPLPPNGSSTSRQSRGRPSAPRPAGPLIHPAHRLASARVRDSSSSWRPTSSLPSLPIPDKRAVKVTNHHGKKMLKMFRRR